MSIQNIPESFLYPESKSVEIFVYDFKMTEDAVNIKVNLTHNMFSFLQLGEKKVKFEDAYVEVNNKQSVLIKSGNCLMTELLDNNEVYFCKLLFFTNKHVTHFLKKHAEYISKLEKKTNTETPFFVIENDDFIHSFVTSINSILNLKTDKTLLLDLKLEEILLYLFQKYGVSFVHYLQSLASAEKYTKFKHIVEANIDSNLSLTEIAFLANMSLSTFKRHFIAEYNTNPGKWLQKKRLALAKHMMENENKKPSEIHKQFGYNSLSNFCIAFKNEFGFSPKEVKY